MRIHAGVFATLVVLGPPSGLSADHESVNCRAVDKALDPALHAGFTAMYAGSYEGAQGPLRRAVRLFSSCPRQTQREDEAETRQVLAGTLWHLRKSDAAYTQLKILKNLNDTFQMADIPSASATAFARGDYRSGYSILRGSLSNGTNDSFHVDAVPAGLFDSGATTAIRQALNAGVDGHFKRSLEEANRALKDAPGSQMTRLVAGLSNLAAMNTLHARDLLFDALLGYDSHPGPNNLLTFNSLMAAYVLIGLRDDRGA